MRGDDRHDIIATVTFRPGFELSVTLSHAPFVLCLFTIEPGFTSIDLRGYNFTDESFTQAV